MKTRLKFIPGIFLVTICSLILPLQTMAQSNGSAGIKGGLNISNLYLDNVTDQNARLGFSTGLFGQVMATDQFALQLELLYSTKGSTAQYAGTINQEVSYNLNYLDLPVLAVIKLGKSAEIHLGAYASYLLNANISYEGDLANGTSPIDKDNLKSFDYGLSGGLGANFGNIQVGARYNLGLVQIANSDAARVFLGDAKNSCAQLYIALDLKSK